jgi:hypothetical protein
MEEMRGGEERENEGRRGRGGRREKEGGGEGGVRRKEEGGGIWMMYQLCTGGQFEHIPN